MKSNILQKLQNNLQKTEQYLFQQINKQKIQQKIFELSAQLAENTPINYLYLWEDIFQFGLQLLIKDVSSEIQEQILDFLSILTETNYDFCIKILNQKQLMQLWQNQIEQTMPNTVTNAYIHLNFYNIGKIIDNQTDKKKDQLFQQIQNQINEKLVQFLHQSLSIKIISELQNFKALINDQNQDQNQKALNIWLQSSKLIQISLGLIISIFENEDEFEDMDDDISDEQEVNPVSAPKNSINYVQSQGQLYLQNNLIVSKIILLLIDKLEYVNESDIEFLQENKQQVMNQAKFINYMTLSALSNMYTSMNDEFSIQIAEKIYLLIERESDPDIILQSLKLFYQFIQKDEILIKTSEESIFNCMSNIISKLINEEIVLVCLDILAYRFQPKFSCSENTVEKLTDFLINLCNQENIMIIAQSLNAIFDIYQEENRDHVFQKKNLMEILKLGYQKFKNIIQNLKGQQNYGFLRDCQSNLRRFIQYKQEKIQ